MGNSSCTRVARGDSAHQGMRWRESYSMVLSNNGRWWYWCPIIKEVESVIVGGRGQMVRRCERNEKRVVVDVDDEFNMNQIIT